MTASLCLCYDIAMDTLEKIKTEKLIRELLAKLLKNRSIDPELIHEEIIPQFYALLGLVVDQPSHSNFWFDDLRITAEKYFKKYTEVEDRI